MIPDEPVYETPDPYQSSFLSSPFLDLVDSKVGMTMQRLGRFSPISRTPNVAFVSAGSG